MNFNIQMLKLLKCPDISFAFCWQCKNSRGSLFANRNETIVFLRWKMYTRKKGKCHVVKSGFYEAMCDYFSFLVVVVVNIYQYLPKYVCRTEC